MNILRINWTNLTTSIKIDCNKIQIYIDSILFGIFFFIETIILCAHSPYPSFIVNAKWYVSVCAEEESHKYIWKRPQQCVFFSFQQATISHTMIVTVMFIDCSERWPFSWLICKLSHSYNDTTQQILRRESTQYILMVILSIQLIFVFLLMLAQNPSITLRYLFEGQQHKSKAHAILFEQWLFGNIFRARAQSQRNSIKIHPLAILWEIAFCLIFIRLFSAQLETNYFSLLVFRWSNFALNRKCEKQNEWFKMRTKHALFVIYMLDIGTI